MNTKWLLVLVAGFFEIGWAAGLKHSDSFLEWCLTVFALCFSFALLVYCSDHLPPSTVYASFVGLGTAGTVLLDMALFGEPFSWSKIFLVALLLTGIIGLKSVTAGKDVTSP